MGPANDFYDQKSKEYSDLYLSLKSKLRWFGAYRFLVFVFIFVPFFIVGFSVWSVCVALFFLILFFYLIKLNLRFDRQKKRTMILKTLVEDEQKALGHSFLHFSSGKEFLDTDHFFSYDLDLFGDGSLFQFLNRTVTLGGKRKLADWLNHPSKEITEIENRQQAILELSQMPGWRLQFLADGKMFEETEALNKEIRSWSVTGLSLNRPTSIRWMIWIIPAFTLLSFIPSILGFTDLFLVLFILMQWFILGFSGKQITQYFLVFGRKSQLLSKYMQLLEKLESQDFKSSYLLKLQKKVKQPSAGRTFGELKKLVAQFEYRQNIIVGFALNSLLLWDIRCVYRLWVWHNKNHRNLAEWLDAVAGLDALISLANYTNNHPAFVFPKLNSDGFVLEAEALGHPLLRDEKRVCNDLEISGWSKVMIVTGANMAGKSTFLRTVGVNLLLAASGAPVCARRMRFTPVDLYTNMRTTDSLLKDESYFFAELKRIKTVLEKLQNGERIFVILDEMLKGTNSVDKLNGSKELIRKLVEFEAVSLIATHDLKLSEMEKEFPQRVFNKCFEIRIENDELVFDYTLSDGVTQTMNATFLMKKMGII